MACLIKICPRVQGQEFGALPSKEDTISFLRDLGHTEVINSLYDVVGDQMHQHWRTFAALINRSLSRKTSALDKLRLSRAQILWGMYHQKNVDYIYGAILPECLTSPEMKESKAYKTYLSYATDEEPVQKSKRVKRSAKKYLTTPATGIIIRETPVKTKSKGKEKVDVSRRKGNDEDDSNDESDAASEHSDEENESDDEETQSDSVKGSDSKNETKEIESDSEKKEDVKDDDEEEDEFIHTPSQYDDENDDKIEGDKDKGMDFDADKNAGLAEPVHANEGVRQDVQHEEPNTQATTLLPIPVSVITSFPQFSQTFTPPPLVSTLTPPSTTKTTNPPTTLLDFASVLKFNERIIALEKEVAELKKDPLHTHVTTLVDNHLETRLGDTREEFMNFLLQSLTERIKEQVKDQLPQILPKEVSNFAPPVIKNMIEESRNEVTLAKASSQPQSSYEAAANLTEFELKKILIDKIKKSKSYLTALEHRECYESLIKSYNLDKDFFSSYDVYSLKHNQKDKDKDEDPSAGSDRGLKKRKTRKDVDATTDQEGNLGDNDDEPNKEVASRRDWFKKPSPPQEPTDLDWNIGKTPQKGPTQKWLTTLAASYSSSTDKSLKDFNELMRTLIDFSGYILNGLKIESLTQEIMLGPAFRLLKGTRKNYVELEYDFEECYKALSKKLDWENPDCGDYLFDLSKPFPLIMRGNHQTILVEYFINNDLKYLQGGVSIMTYTTSKAAQYDLPCIEDMVLNIWSLVKVAYDKHALWGISHWREKRKTFYGYTRGLQSSGDVYSTNHILAVTHVTVMRKHGYGYLEEIVVRRANNELYRFKDGDDVADFPIALRMFTRSLVIQKRVEDLQLGVESYQKQINITKPDTIRPYLRKRHPYTPYKDPQGFIYVDDEKKNRLMRSDELYKFSDGTLTRLRSSLEYITKNINMEYLLKRRWSTLEKKITHYMIKDINKLLKERRMMRSLEKFIGGRPYRTELRLLQRTI
ncbi:hypothetical protein Tco_0418477 [Tanacetum coccineum]